MPTVHSELPYHIVWSSESLQTSGHSVSGDLAKSTDSQPTCPTALPPPHGDRPQSSQPARASASSADDGLLSAGSALHESGKCKPCAFLHHGHCSEGRACCFCHHPHKKEFHALSKKKRVRYQRMVARREGGHQGGKGGDPGEEEEEEEEVIST